VKIRTAFILGAGMGTRLRPLTVHRPKPLLPVGGRPLITYAMDHCLSIGVERFIVNTHHCAEAYEEAFPGRHWRGRPIAFRHEPVLLDTAGGLKNIEDLLDPEETILVYNGDILSDLPLEALVEAHKGEEREVTLALRSEGPIRNVCLDATSRICDLRNLLGNPGVRHCLFTGIYVVERRFLRRLARGRIESVVPVFAGMIRESPGSVASVVIDGGAWQDVGDVETYVRIREGSSNLNYGSARSAPEDAVTRSPACGAASGSGSTKNGNPPIFIGPPGGSGLPAAADLPGEEKRPAADAPSTVEQEAPAAHFYDFIRVTLGLAAGERIALDRIGKGGSDRSYFRVTGAGMTSSILMQYGRMYRENELYEAVASSLRKADIAVPAIFGHDPERRLILMEDLGDVDLHALRGSPWEVRCPLYEKVLASISRLHALPPDRMTAGLRLMPCFDEALYRWEQRYFQEECVRDVFGIELDDADRAALEAELSRLADRLLGTPPVLVHRDLQSQNILIRCGEPVLIDFQGMRVGSSFYDLGSLLYDPYVAFPESGREGLLRMSHAIDGFGYSWEAFRGLFLLASAQRLMQALGAYGFLGLKRAKPHFLAHIRPALENLVAVTAETGCLPRLHSLARRILGSDL